MLAKAATGRTPGVKIGGICKMAAKDAAFCIEKLFHILYTFMQYSVPATGCAGGRAREQNVVIADSEELNSMKFSRKLRILWSTLVVGVLLAAFSLCAAAQSPSREIAIVYDDSGSMVREDNIYQANWCRAKYALEVFSAMLQDGDEMTVYPMSNYRDSVAGRTAPLHLSGSDSPQSRTQAVHDMKLANSGTYFNAARAAIAALEKADAGRERWLIILTDGNFNNISTSQVESELREAAGENIKVIYFVMSTVGNAVDSIRNDPVNGLYSYTVNSSAEILSGVIEVANQVFNQRQLGQKHILAASDSVTISLDVPVRELVVFAQGKSIRIGKLEGGSGSWTAQTQTNVKYSDDLPTANNYDAGQIVVDTSLEGSLATFKPGQILAAGNYKLQVSDTSNVEIYYTPAVAAALELTDADGNQYTVGLDNNTLPSGTYQIAAYLIDPLTGMPLNSDLVDMEQCSLQVENNGETQTVDDILSGKAKLVLRTGDFEGVVTIGMDHYQTETSTFNGHATPAPWPGTLSVELPDYPADPAYNFGVEAAEGQKGIRLTAQVTDPNGGGQPQLLSQDAWENAVVTTEVIASSQESGKTGWQKFLYNAYSVLHRPFRSKKADAVWTAQRGSDTATWSIMPQLEDSAAEATYGTVTLRTSVNAEGREYTMAAFAEYEVKIAPPPLEQVVSYLTKFTIGFVLLLFFLILFIRKKRLPRDLDMTYILTGIAPGKFAGKKRDPKHVRIRRKFTLFRPETATISMSQPGAVRAPNLKIVACTRELDNKARRFHITNIEEFAKVVPGTRVNANPVEAGANKRVFSSNTCITCKPNQMVNGAAKCEFQFTKKPKRHKRSRKSR